MITRRNVDPRSALRRHPENYFRIQLPATDTDAVRTSMVLADGPVVLDGAGVWDPTGANTPLYLPHPSLLCFTLGNGLDQFSYRIIGVNHLGEPRNQLGTKGAASNTQWLTSLHQIHTAWKRIDSIELSGVILDGGGSNTLEIGFAYGTAGNLIPRLPLPVIIPSSSHLAGVVMTDAGGGTITPAVEVPMTMGGLGEGGRILPVSFTAVAAQPTSALEFKVCIKPEAFGEQFNPFYR